MNEKIYVAKAMERIVADMGTIGGLSRTLQKGDLMNMQLAIESPELDEKLGEFYEKLQEIEELAREIGTEARKISNEMTEGLS